MQIKIVFVEFVLNYHVSSNICLKMEWIEVLTATFTVMCENVPVR